MGSDPSSAAVIEIDCVVPDSLEDEIGGSLFGLPVLGVAFEAMPQRRTLARIYLDADATSDVDILVERLAMIGGEVSPPTPAPQRDWLAAYRNRARPFEVGERWWIDPQPDCPTPAPEGRFRLALEPRRAFGSGSHETTQLVLHMLEDDPPTGRSVLDVGTGNLVLALAAERLGARETVALDIDPVAVWIASQVRRCQDWPSEILVFAGTLDCVAERSFDLVMCNMLSMRMRPMLEAFAHRLTSRGSALLAGMLTAERARFERELRAVGLEVRHEMVLGEWVGWRVGHA